jgi:hypothetical protein
MAVDLKKEQKKVVTNLTTIFNAESMKTAITQVNLQSIIEKQLNILSYLEKTNGSKVLKSATLLKKYNELSGKSYVIDKNVQYVDNDVLADDINYLGVYIRNMYKVDLEALADGKEAKIVTPTVTDVTPKQESPMAGIPFMMPGMGAGGAENNPMYAAMANARVQADAAQGKVYLFKTKPKLMPILKLIMGICLAICGLTSIFVGIGMVLCKGSSFLISNVGFGDKSAEYVGGLGMQSSIYFIFGAVVLFSAYSTLTPLLYKNTKRFNENRLYRFQWQSFIFTMIIFSFILIFGLVSGDSYIFNGNCAP